MPFAARLLTTLCCLVAAALAAPPDANGWRASRFHDPSTPIRDNGLWWIFSTGNGVVTRHSKDLKTWEQADPVFKTFPAWHREVVADQKGYLWAPDVIKSGNRFLLYYSVSSWGSNVSAIGLASNTTLDPTAKDYAWKDEGMVIHSERSSPFNAIDPQLFADGKKLWMVFGSFWKGIHLIELDPDTGKRIGGEPPKQLAWHETIEAAALLEHHGYYYLFVNWGLCCKGLDSSYEIRVGRSRKITGPYLDADGNDMATGGGSAFLASRGDQVGPGHPSFIEEPGGTRMFYHYYDRKHAGLPVLGDASLRWNKAGWPEL